MLSEKRKKRNGVSAIVDNFSVVPYKGMPYLQAAMDRFLTSFSLSLKRLLGLMPECNKLNPKFTTFEDAEKSGEGRITRHGRKNLKTMQDIVDKPDYGLTTFQYNVKKAREAKKKKAEDKKKKAIDVRTLIKPKRDKTLPKTSLDKDNKKLKKLYDGWL